MRWLNHWGAGELNGFQPSFNMDEARHNVETLAIPTNIMRNKTVSCYIHVILFNEKNSHIRKQSARQVLLSF